MTSYAAKDEARADETMKRLGIGPDDPSYSRTREIALRGWPAWRIAEYIRLSRATIAALGGPAVDAAYWERVKPRSRR